MSVKDSQYNQGGSSEHLDMTFCNQLINGFSGNIFAVQLHNDQLQTLFVGQNVAELAGYDVEELKSEPTTWIDIIHPADREPIRAAYERLLIGEPFAETYRIFRKDGQQLWIKQMAVSRQDPDTGILHIISMISEIGDGRLIPELPLHYRQLLDKSPNAVCIRDMDGRLIFCNKAYAELFGYESADQLIGADYLDFIPQECVEEYEREVRPKILSGLWTGELKMKRRDGEERDIRASTNIIHDLDGYPAAIYVILTDVTEIKQTTEDIRKSKENYQLLIENTTDLIVKTDTQGRFMFVSSSYCELFGKTQDELIGKSFMPLVHEADVESTKQVMEQLFIPPYKAYMEQRAWTKDGWRWLAWSDKAVLDEEDRVVAIVGAGRDITDKKRAEEALRESEDLLSAVQNSIPANVAVLDRNGWIIAVNHAWKQFAIDNGAPELAEGSVGMNYLAVCRNSEGAGSKEAWQARMGLEALLDGQWASFQMEYECNPPEGRRWFVMYAARLQSERGGLVVSHVNITETKIAQEALRQSEEKFRTLAENVDVVLFKMTPDRYPITLAGMIENVTGYSAETLRLHPEIWKNLTHPDDRNKVVAKLAEIAVKGEPDSLQTRIIDPNGQVRWIRAHLTPRYDEEQRLDHFTGVLINITEQVKIQQREARHMARMAALAGISQLFTSTLSTQHIIDCAIKMTADVLNCSCSMFKEDPETGRMSHMITFAPHEEIAKEIDTAMEQAGVTLDLVFRETDLKPRLVEDLRKEDPISAEFARLSGIVRAMSAPVFVAGELFAMLAASRGESEPLFDEEDLWFISEVASHASAALTNAALYSRQARIAETLQRSLIPESAYVPGLEIATAYSPAQKEAEVGGDFFDIISFPDGKTGLVVGDVSGKGLEAAIHTAEAKYMLRGFATQYSDPGYVISSLNRALWAFTNEFTFVTLFYGLIDPVAYTINYSNAGHESPLLLRSDRNIVEALSPNGPILGVVTEQAYNTQSVKLTGNDMLVCYTDGITDVPDSSGERLGCDRLADIIMQAPVGSPRQLLDHIMEKVHTYGQNRQPDDQVVVILKLVTQTLQNV
ncbi:PAS domain S-box protein [bacterium]|nr:PAS domain S-box protein [bacterium]